MSQSQSNIDDLKKREAVAQAEKAAIDAELALEKSKKTFTESKAPIDPLTESTQATLEAAKSAAAVATARKAQVDAELAELKARIGEVPSSGIKGSVTLNEGATKFETSLLSAKAAVTAGKIIAKAVNSATSENPNPKLLVFAAGETPDLHALSAFFAQRAVLLQALTHAVSFSEEVMSRSISPAKKEYVAEASMALDAVSKILGFFKSDFEVQGTELTADSTLLAKAVVGELLISLRDKKPDVYLKSTFNPNAITTVRDKFAKELESLTFQRNKAVEATRKHEQESSAIQIKLSKITGDTLADRESKRQLGDDLKNHQEALDHLKTALTAHDTFVVKLLSPDPNVTAMSRELDVWNALNDSSSVLLIVKMDKAGGSSYSEKNVWTAFGVMPLKVMGGVVASYTLFVGSTGAILASGVVPVHGGYSKVNKVGDLFEIQ